MYIQDGNKLWVAMGDEPIYMEPKMANRHGLIAGATGTGKTVTLKVLAESFSDMGVPVFLADIKGDVSGMCKPGEANKHVDERVEEFKIQNFTYSAYPVRFWDVYGKRGIPVRTTVSDMGPELLARILELNDTQSGVLGLVFKIADDNGWLLVDMKDLRAMLQYAGDHSDEFQVQYGNIAAQTVGAIQRSMVNLESKGGDIFFGEPELDIKDWMAVDDNGRGIINLLHCVQLVQDPLLYSTFLLWMLSDLYEMLPEAGDLDKPKMVFFFDEAHLLFNDAPKALLTKVEQVARLIRSKGVGIYFITQQPDDIPDTVLSQLGNKIQHALRAYTPKDKKAVKAAAESFRANPAFDSEQVLGELGTGEALVSLLDEKGAPTMVQRAKILPPRSFMGVAEDDLVMQRIQGNPLNAKYGTAVDNESAFEQLNEKKEAEEKAKQEAEEAAKKAAEEAAAAAQKAKEEEAAAKQKAKEEAELAKKQEKLEEEERRRKEREEERKEIRHERAAEKAAQRRASTVNKVVNSTVGTIGREVSKGLLRGLLGNLIK